MPLTAHYATRRRRMSSPSQKGTANGTGRAHIRQGAVYKAADSYTAKAAKKKIVNTGDSLIIGASMQYEFGDESNSSVHIGGVSYTLPLPRLKASPTVSNSAGKADRQKRHRRPQRQGLGGKHHSVSFRAGLDWKF